MAEDPLVQEGSWFHVSWKRKRGSRSRRGERRGVYRGIPGFPPVLMPPKLRKSPSPQAGHVPGLHSQAPGALTLTSGPNSGSGRHFLRKLPLTLPPANPHSPSGGRLRPNAAALPLAPTKTGHLYFIAICREQCQSPNTLPLSLSYWLSGQGQKRILVNMESQSKPKCITQNSSGIGLN